VIHTSYSIGRSCPKKIFLSRIPKQMTLNNAKFASTCLSTCVGPFEAQDNVAKHNLAEARYRDSPSASQSFSRPSQPLRRSLLGCAVPNRSPQRRGRSRSLRRWLVGGPSWNDRYFEAGVRVPFQSLRSTSMDVRGVSYGTSGRVWEKGSAHRTHIHSTRMAVRVIVTRPPDRRTSPPRQSRVSDQPVRLSDFTIRPCRCMATAWLARIGKPLHPWCLL